ncbi:hypothetical protein U1Q18_006235 [Sarracenia purpurea var. burkii]
MDFLKVKKFRKAHKPNLEKDSDDKPVSQAEEPKNDKIDDMGNSVNADTAAEAEDDDDDFIMDEVKRRLKELRRNSFMVLIPEESGIEDEEEEEEGETSSSECRTVEAEGQQPWCGFDAVYDKYCEQMLLFDRLSAQQLNEVVVTYFYGPSCKVVEGNDKKDMVRIERRCGVPHHLLLEQKYDPTFLCIVKERPATLQRCGRLVTPLVPTLHGWHHHN